MAPVDRFRIAFRDNADRPPEVGIGRVHEAVGWIATNELEHAGAHIGAPEADAVMQRHNAVGRQMLRAQLQVGCDSVGRMQAIDEYEVERALVLAQLGAGQSRPRAV